MSLAVTSSWVAVPEIAATLQQALDDWSDCAPRLNAVSAALNAGGCGDARPRDFWKMSRIPGALPLPEDDFDRAFGEAEERLRRASGIVVYCSGFGCEASHIVARKLKEKGGPAAVLNEGLPAWQEAGYPVRQGRQP